MLAEPGGGKTWAFDREAENPGCVRVTARDFANVEPPAAWAAKTIFIDGIDEMRADSTSRDGPIDAIVRRLSSLGNPRFRLSCREADWLAAVDHPALAAVASARELHVLQLDPLTDDEVLELLRRRADRVPDPNAFMAQAAARNLDSLLRNPLLLTLLVEAVGEQWPASRAEVYQLACVRMADEHNPVIDAKKLRTAPLREDILNDAGLLSAVLLLSGADCVNLGSQGDEPGGVSLRSLPASLGLKYPHHALSTSLFSAEGPRRFPRHRSVAEYLAAHAVGNLISSGGLPLTRVLAIMSGVDGGVVEPLRGLFAWMAVTCPSERNTLIDRDPLACVLYGDVRAFTVAEKVRLFHALRRQADRFVWFRNSNWASAPFGALGTTDMVPALRDLMLTEDTSPEHQSLLDCVLDAVAHGDSLPGVLDALRRLVENDQLRDEVRSGALDAWMSQAAADVAQPVRWLEDIKAGRLVDKDHDLEGRLLRKLYPTHLSASQVMAHFHVSNRKHIVGTYKGFWSEVVQRTARKDRALLVDGLVTLKVPKVEFSVHHDLTRLFGEFISNGLESLDGDFDISRIHTWLKLGLSEHEFPALKGEAAAGIRRWLDERPDVQKALVRHGYALVAPDPQSNQRHFWSAESVLYEARRPRDWYRWMLTQAEAALMRHVALAEYCFRQAAHQAIAPTPHFDIDMAEVERWTDAHRATHPQVDAWLESTWSWSLDDWHGDEHRRQKAAAAEHAADLSARWKHASPVLEEIERGTANAWLMHRLACAYLERYSNIRGETALARVQEFLGCGPEDAERAIEGLSKTLERGDFPSVDDILASEPMNPRQPLAAPSLLAAQLLFDADPTVIHAWSDERVKQLVAFHLVSDGAQLPAWYLAIAQERPALVAEVLIPFARNSIATRAEHFSTGLWPLARDARLQKLSELVIPPLLESFPARARSSQLRRLNTELLPAAYRHLSTETLKSLVRARLDQPCLASSQRMPWLLAAHRYAPHQASGEIMRLAGRSTGRKMRLSALYIEQAQHAEPSLTLPALPLGRWIELIAPPASPEFPEGAHWVGDLDHRRDVARGLVHRLGALALPEAGLELHRLRELKALSRWRILIDAALSDHARLVRNSAYVHAPAERVAATLSSDGPANSLDLAALVQHHLDTLQQRLVGDDTNGLLQFWRDPDEAKTRRPRTENECRDRLLEKLRDRLLPMGVTIHKEASHANEKRADLRAEVVSANVRHVVPVEIKKDDHEALWSAWRLQLERLYMNDPAAAGVGIYLCLWFGWGTTPNPDGDAPASASELEAQLRMSIPREDRHRLLVHVLDLSLPSPSSGEAKRRKRRNPLP